MSEFDAFLKRSFAEAHEPADDGFSVNVAHAVAHREKTLQLRTWAQNIAMAAGGAVALYGLYTLLAAFAPPLVGTAGLTLQDLYLSATAVSGDAAGSTLGTLQSLGAGLTQVLLIAGALAGGAVAYRAVQQD